MRVEFYLFSTKTTERILFRFSLMDVVFYEEDLGTLCGYLWLGKCFSDRKCFGLRWRFLVPQQPTKLIVIYYHLTFSVWGV